VSKKKYKSFGKMGDSYRIGSRIKSHTLGYKYAFIEYMVRNAVIDREREGEQLDRAPLKTVSGISVEIGMSSMGCHDSDFESTVLEDTAAYYS
jgi:hypothetical protein